MKVHHRIAGNTPKNGYFSCASSDFPQNNWATEVKGSMRLPMVVGTGVQNSATGVVETQRSYEIHSLDYEHIGLVLSVEGVLVKNDGTISGRRHAYSHIVSLANDVNCMTGTPEAWLQFNDFTPLEEFWNSSMKNDTELKESEWMPPVTHLPPWQGVVSAELQDALALRYWRAATMRFFDHQNDTLRVCLSDQKEHATLIEESKQFFWSKILSALPKAVWHILSMSAAVKHDKVQVYQPTALAFVLPSHFADGVGNERFFDLRTGAFVPLTALEKKFIASMREQGSIASLSALYKQYTAVEEHAAAFEHVSFVADYTLVWLLFRLENDVLTCEERVRLWQDLHARLEKQHGFAWQKVDALLSVLEEPLLLQHMELAVPLDDSMIRFLMAKAFRLKEAGTAMRYTALLAKHQCKEFSPFFAAELNEKMLQDSVDDTRIQQVTGALFAACDINESRREELGGDRFRMLCGACPALLKAFQTYLEAQYQKRENMSLFLLPLGVRYLNKHHVLARSLQQLKREYVHSLPDETVCRVLMLARDAFDKDNCALLDEYLLQCFHAHQPEIRPILYVCETLGTDSSNFLCSVLQGTAGYDPRMLNEMLGSLLPLCSDKEAVHQALLAYVERVLDGAIAHQSQELDWLRAVDGNALLFSSQERAMRGLQHFIAYYGERCVAPEQTHFLHAAADLEMLGQQERATYEEGVKKIYERLGEVGRAQLQYWLDDVGFSTVSDTVYIRGVYMDILRFALAEGWRKQDYFKTIDLQRPRWRMGNVTPEELLQQGNDQRARQALNTRYGTFHVANEFEQEGRLIDQQPSDVFSLLAKEVLSKTMDGQYESMLMNDGSMERAVYTAQVARKLQAIQSLGSLRAQCVLDEMRRIQDFILTYLPACTWENVATETKNRIGGLVRMGEHPLADAMQGWLYREMRSCDKLSFRKRMAAICLLGTRSNGAVAGKRLLSIVSCSDKACAAPFAEENVPLFSQIAALFAFAESIDESYAAAILRALSEDSWTVYTERVKAQRKQASKLIPWMMNDAIGLREKIHPTKAFVKWLTD